MVLTGFKGYETDVNSDSTNIWGQAQTLLGTCKLIEGFEVENENCQTLDVIENGEWPGARNSESKLSFYHFKTHQWKNFIYCPEYYVATALNRSDGVVRGMTCCPLVVVG